MHNARMAIVLTLPVLLGINHSCIVYECAKMRCAPQQTGQNYYLAINYLAIEAAIAKYSVWTSDCTNNGLSAGLFISICGAGKGLCTCVPKKVGPFQD